MKVAVLGGGINGVMIAWELCKANHDVTLFEKNTVMKETSSSSTKLLHGGLRYLENYEFGLVREALKDRAWWIKRAPHLAKPIKIFIPIYKKSRRPAWLYELGLYFYDFFAGKSCLGKYQKYMQSEMKNQCTDLKVEGLLKGFSFFDGQMDDYKLGLWAIEKVRQYRNFILNENTSVYKVTEEGKVFFNNRQKKFDKVINTTGPWAGQLLKENNIDLGYELDLIRGSHIVIDKKIDNGYFLEVPNERRVFFALPYNGFTLIGTTEVQQTIFDEIKPSKEEVKYLINAFNYYFIDEINDKNIVNTFAGVRLMVKNSNNPNKIKREHAFQYNQNLISVFGGKWTTARQLAKKLLKTID